MHAHLKTIQPLVRGLGLVALTASLVACENLPEENNEDISQLQAVLQEQAEAVEALDDKNAQLEIALQERADAMDALLANVNTMDANRRRVRWSGSRVDGVRVSGVQVMSNADSSMRRSIRRGIHPPLAPRPQAFREGG